MSEELTKLIQKRSIIRGQLTRNQTFLNKLDVDNMSKFKKSEIQLRIPKVEAMLSEFEFIQSQIEALDTSENAVESNERFRDSFETDYYTVLATFQTLVQDDVDSRSELLEIVSQVNSQHGSGSVLHENVSPSGQPIELRHNDNQTSQVPNTHFSEPPCDQLFVPGNNSNEFQPVHSHYSNNIPQMHIKLPQLTLPKFDGNLDQWLNFHDMFVSLIHNNNMLTPVQKFQYLKTSVLGDAAAVIQSLEITADNYTIAFNLIKERFENKSRIIDNHFKALFEFEKLTKESHIQLQSLINNVRKNVRALKSLNLPTDHWDAILIYLIRSKLDSVTRREWEKYRSETEKAPTIEELCGFLSKKCQLLESIHPSSKRQSNAERPTRSSHITIKKHNCKLCNSNHAIFQCRKFCQMTIPNRINEMRRLRLCKNCFKDNHKTNECPSVHNCKICSLRHNTLLHLDNQSETAQTLDSSSIHENETARSSVNLSKFTTNQILLPTAMIEAYDHQGQPHQLRVLLDSGSQSNFIQESVVKRLNLKTKKVNIPISGISSSHFNIKNTTSITLHSRLNSFKCTLSCLVLNQITDALPQTSVNLSKLEIPSEIELADPTFSRPDQINILVGAEVFWSLLCIGQIPLGKNMPVLQKTHFGWIVSGRIHQSNPHKQKYLCNLSLNEFNKLDLQKQMSAFWQSEEINLPHPLSQEELECEELFKNTTTRGQDGKFIVELPFQSNVSSLGDSRTIAERRLALLQKRLDSNPRLNDHYAQFMEEYIKLGHMSAVNYSKNETPVFFPHHAVVRSDKLTTKTRVVFDASCKTTSGLSLNDTLKVGPVVQSTLFTILIRFRLHPVAITSDCEKMYRQVWIHQDQRKYQNILWNNKTYQLNTLTYGTAAAPYLATRCIKQISVENSHNFPEACKIISEAFYVDDLITSCESIAHAKLVINQIHELLESYGFPLRKWSSNVPEVLENMTSTNIITHFNEHQSIKTLGLDWRSETDTLQYPFNPKPNSNTVTKRSILSTISSLFDPLGLISPILVKAKLIMQRLWQLNLNWDESLPADLYTLWSSYKEEFPFLEQILIPRHVLCNEPIDIQLHGFSDASEHSYGATIYLRSTNSQGIHHVHLLCSKGRVAPLKALTIPRLELMAAHLLAKLVSAVYKDISTYINISEIHCWCDSTIVLSWFKKVPNQLKTFVAHRVSDILSLTDISYWHHVLSGDNPADILSRGATPLQLRESHIWFHGPKWLSENQSTWPALVLNTDAIDLPEIKPPVTFTCSTREPSLISTLLTKYSSLTKLQRVLAFCCRFGKNSSKHHNKFYGSLTVEELSHSLKIILRHVQQETFSEELTQLNQNLPVPKRSKLKTLNPFIDEDNLIRLGGRIRHSSLPVNKKFPYILPSKHPFTELVIHHYHTLHLHAGTQATFSAIRNKFWILSGKSRVKQFIHKCVICKRFETRPPISLMGDLPENRVSPARPFSICGTDFAGPFSIREGTGRGKRAVKGYLCIFVCFSTKAVHLEVVGSLSTEAFLACLKRFIARRGHCHEIHSDNGTNLVGANNEIKQWYKMQSNNSHCDTVAHYLSKLSIQWKFTPARSPHFGGLWEAAVRSVKRHLYKITSNSIFSYEEFNTLCCQIEAILNSRPLLPLSSDPEDFQVLTPGHFLVGDSLMSLPEPTLCNLKQNQLSHFQKIQQMQQRFWKQWSNDYLTLLQTRHKWQRSTISPPSMGSVVLLREPNLPPLLWRMGRVVALHPGPDSIVRVLSIKTSTGVVKRSITKVIPLVTEETRDMASSCSDTSESKTPSK